MSIHDFNDTVDHKSMALFTVTILLNAFNTNNATASIALFAGATTVIYNLIKIYKEVKRK